MVVRYIGLFLLLFIHLSLKGQQTASGDSLLELQIIGDKVCLDKKGNLNFSYYFKNVSDEYLVVIDYFEPCIWENPSYYHPLDSMQTLGLFLEITDSMGNVVHPIPDTTLQEGKQKMDSSAFYKVYNSKRADEYEYHTRVLRPKNTLINFFYLKPNKRKCFQPGTFRFDPANTYKIRFYYWAFEDARDLINHSSISRNDVVFVGKIASKQVEMCFEKK